MNGITFKGIHSSSIPATWKSIKRPVLPTPKSYTVSLPESDSEYDFSQFNEEGRLHYQDRVIEGTLTVTDRGMYSMQLALTKLARWLIGGWGDLEFDDMPGTIWTAKIENVDQVQYELGKAGIATIYFRVKPFSKFVLNSNSGEIPLDSSVMIDTSLPLDTNLDETYSFNGTTVLQVQNYGDWYTKPIISITGTFNYVEIQCNGKTFRYNGSCSAGQTVVIDCNKFITTKNNVNDSLNTIGDYFELSPGTNDITILSNGSGEINFTFDYNFIYGAVI